MTALVQWLWQGTALACAVAVALRCAPRVNAASRHAVWWLTLVATLTLPFADGLAQIAKPLLASFEAATVPVTVSLGVSPPTVADQPAPWLSVPAAPDWLMACGVGIWLGTVMLGCGRLVSGMRTVRRLKHGSRPLPSSVVATLRTVPGSVRGAQLRCSAAVDGACALGLSGRPTVVVSDRLLSALEPDALDLIVLHELTHLRRYDDWWRALQSCVMIVAGLHPAIRFISSRIDLEREAACDDTVAALSGAPRRYAASLAAVADLLAGAGAERGHALVPNATGSGSLLARVQRLLDPRGTRNPSLQAGALAAAGVVVALALVGLGRVPPIIAVAAVEAISTVNSRPESLLDGRVIGGIGPLLAPPSGLRPDGPSPARRRVALRTAVGTAVAQPASARARQRPRGAPVEVTQDGDVTPSASTGQARSETAQVAAEAVAPLVGRLPARPLPTTDTLSVAFRGNNVRNRESSGDNGWASTGATTRRTGAAIGNYFSRAGKAVASHF